MAGVIAPVGFLTICFAMVIVRPDVIRAQGWASWPSSMATGGPPAALPQIGAFLWLALWYPVFALGALKPALRDGVTTGGFLAIAIGDLMLAFPTDAPGVGTSWHGTVHLLGVMTATVATLVAAGASLLVTRDRADFRPWRIAAPVLFASALVGLFAGFDLAWAKVVYVVGITLPVVVLARCVSRVATTRLTST
jgi:hypothetical protein